MLSWTVCPNCTCFWLVPSLWLSTYCVKELYCSTINVSSFTILQQISVQFWLIALHSKYGTMCEEKMIKQWYHAEPVIRFFEKTHTWRCTFAKHIWMDDAVIRENDVVSFTLTVKSSQHRFAWKGFKPGRLGIGDNVSKWLESFLMGSVALIRSLMEGTLWVTSTGLS